MNKLKTFIVMALLLTSVLAAGVSAADVPITIENVWINGNEVQGGELRNIERGEPVEVELRLQAESDAQDVEIEAEINGYEYSDKEKVRDETDLFDVEAGQTYFKTLSIELPDTLDRDDYRLRIEISDRSNDEIRYDAELSVDTPRHELRIDDVMFSPGTKVQAGRSLLASIRLDNFGKKDEEDVKVSLNIDEIGVSDVDYIEEIESGDEKTSEELYVRIPESVEAGKYTAMVEVEYDEGYETVTQSFDLEVVAAQKATEEKAVISVGPQNQNIVAGGKEAIYPITITNAGSESKTYTLALTTGNWAESRLSSNVLVVNAGETKVAYAYVGANEDATTGEKLMNLAVESGDKTLKEINLKANVVESDEGISLKEGLQVGLVALVVLLVIIGLIVGFGQMRNRAEEDEEYY